MADLLVKLYDIRENLGDVKKLEEAGIRVFRPMAPNRKNVLDFVAEHFGDKWAGECACAFSRSPIACYIAAKDKEIIGFACYDATAKGFFGPIGVRKDRRAARVGASLLRACLLAMRQDGYGYAIIGGGHGVFAFYHKEAGAVLIEGSDPGVYADML